jgi:hypothetical protein
MCENSADLYGDKGEHPVKILTVFLLSVVFTVGCKHPTVQKKLSDGCATSSLLALKAIQRDTFIPETGSHTVSRITQEKIDAADVAAASPEERAVASNLNAVYDGQLFLNAKADLLQHEEKIMAFGGETAGLKAEREENSKQVDGFGMGNMTGCLLYRSETHLAKFHNVLLSEESDVPKIKVFETVRVVA